MGYIFENGDIEQEDISEFELLVEKLAFDFNQETKQINAFLFTAGQLEEAFTSDLTSDLNLV